MKSEMRDVLARQSFEDKIRKVSELIQLSRKVNAQRADHGMKQKAAEFAAHGVEIYSKS